MRTTTGLLALAALSCGSVAWGAKHDSSHAMNFLKMVETQALEAEEDRRLQILSNVGKGQLVSGTTNILNNAANSGAATTTTGAGLLSGTNPITGDPVNQGAIGVGSLVGTLNNPQKAVGTVLDSILPGNQQGAGTGGGALAPVAAQLGTKPTNVYTVPAGKPNAMGSVTPGQATNLPTAPDSCGSPLTIDIESFTEYRVFVDGNQVGYSNGVQRKRIEAKHGSSGAVTIAVEATRDRDMTNFGMVDGLHINVTACGQTWYSDQDWVCTDVRPWTHTWRLSSYTPFNWMSAALVHDAATMVDGSKNFFIWSKQSCANLAAGVPEKAFCRLKIKPSCKNHIACYPEQSATKPDTTCLSGCAMETMAMDKCAAIGHEIGNKCGSCSAAYMTYYQQYCKTQGCSAAQCKAPAEEEFKPDLKCLAACQEGTKGFKSQCEQQAYIFQSGCAAICGPETMAYARDQCLADYKCQPTQCSTFKDQAAQMGTGKAPAPSPGGSSGGSYTPPPTPDLTCFFRCLSGMNQRESYCDKIQYALTSGCHNCPDNIIQWAHSSCLDYQDPDGNKCTPEQCGVKA